MAIKHLLACRLDKYLQKPYLLGMETEEKRLLRKVFVRPFLSKEGYKGIVQNIPVCPSCSILLDSAQEGIDFEFKKVNHNGREIDLVVPACPKCGKTIEPAYYTLS